MHHSFKVLFVVSVAVIVGAAGTAAAADGDFDLGLRAVIVTAGGEPANDMIAGGIYARYHFNDRWAIGGAVDSYGFDFERPFLLLGLGVDPDLEEAQIDASTDSLLLTVWAERIYPSASGKIDWFWTAGLGFATVDAGDVSGPLLDGGTYTITTDAGTEFVLGISGGLRYNLGEHWMIEAALRADQHFADWKVVEVNSGAQTTLDDYFAYGAHLGFAYRF